MGAASKEIDFTQLVGIALTTEFAAAKDLPPTLDESLFSQALMDMVSRIPEIETYQELLNTLVIEVERELVSTGITDDNLSHISARIRHLAAGIFADASE